MSPFLFAGVCASLAGLLTFLVIHHFWIQPIWFIAPIGILIAALGGLAVGWSYREIYPSLPPRPWTFLALVAVIAIILAPSIILAQFRAPLIDLNTFTIPAPGGSRAVILFFFELVVTSVLVGAAVGWFLGHSRDAVISTSVAGLVYALGPGHNIPFLGNTPVVGKGTILLLAITLVSAFVLVEVSTYLMKK